MIAIILVYILLIITMSFVGLLWYGLWKLYKETQDASERVTLLENKFESLLLAIKSVK